MQTKILFRGLIALAALSFTLTGHAQQRNNRQFLNIDEDSSVSPPQTYINYKSDSLYNIVLSGGKVTSMYVNGRQVPADRYYVYEGLIRRMKEQMQRDREQAVRDREQAGRDRAQAERDKIQAEKDREQAVRDKAQAERDQAQAMRDKEQAERDRQQAARDKVQAEEDKAMLQRVLAEVVKEGLAPDEKSITSLVLDESVFYVNGKKQSDELQKKFKEKFCKKEGYSIHYHNRRMSIGRVED